MSESVPVPETAAPRPLSTIDADAITAKVNAIKLANERMLKECAAESKQNGEATPSSSRGPSNEAGASGEQPAASAASSSGSNQRSETDPDDIITVAEKSYMQKIIRTKLINSKYDLEVKRKDPSSPLYSVKSFEALHLKPELLRGVYLMGFNAPSKIQETAVPTLLADPPQNMIAQSQSGTGKTAAFVLSMLSRVDPSLNYPQALCLSPTYELAVQTGEIVAKMASYLPEISIKFALRGEDPPTGNEHIIIGTPGKVVDWGLKMRCLNLRELTVFVLDEADVMIATQGHQEQSLRIRKLLSPKCQMMLFSATYDNEVMDFAEMMVPNAVVIKLRREEESLDNIKQYYVKCKNPQEKYLAMKNIYGICTVNQAMIFCQTKKTAGWLCEEMTKEGHGVALLTGDLTVEQRITILDRFREGKHKVLITTNVLARGIDIEQVTFVVNFDLPVDKFGNADCETYLHRIGRCGRFGKTGISINLIDSEDSYKTMKQIQEHFSVNIKLLDPYDLEQMEKLENS